MAVVKFEPDEDSPPASNMQHGGSSSSTSSANDTAPSPEEVYVVKSHPTRTTARRNLALSHEGSPEIKCITESVLKTTSLTNLSRDMGNRSTDSLGHGSKVLVDLREDVSGESLGSTGNVEKSSSFGRLPQQLSPDQGGVIQGGKTTLVNTRRDRATKRDGQRLKIVKHDYKVGDIVWFPTAKNSVYRVGQIESIQHSIVTIRTKDDGMLFANVLIDALYPKKTDSTKENTPSGDVIEEIIKSRFFQGLIYTDVSSTLMMYVNPFREMPIYTSHFMDRYITLDESLPSHIFQTAALTYKSICEGASAVEDARLHAGANADQENGRNIFQESIFVTGRMDSMKQNTYDHLMSFFIKSAAPDDASAVKLRLLSTILNPFFTVTESVHSGPQGTSRSKTQPATLTTKRNKGMWKTCLVFDADGFIMQVIVHLLHLETSLTRPTTGRSYDIFYLVFALLPEQDQSRILRAKNHPLINSGGKKHCQIESLTTEKTNAMALRDALESFGIDFDSLILRPVREILISMCGWASGDEEEFNDSSKMSVRSKRSGLPNAYRGVTRTRARRGRFNTDSHLDSASTSNYGGEQFKTRSLSAHNNDSDSFTLVEQSSMMSVTTTGVEAEIEPPHNEQWTQVEDLYEHTVRNLFTALNRKMMVANDENCLRAFDNFVEQYSNENEIAKPAAKLHLVVVPSAYSSLAGGRIVEEVGGGGFDDFCTSLLTFGCYKNMFPNFQNGADMERIGELLLGVGSLRELKFAVLVERNDFGNKSFAKPNVDFKTFSRVNKSVKNLYQSQFVMENESFYAPTETKKATFHSMILGGLHGADTATFHVSPAFFTDRAKRTLENLFQSLDQLSTASAEVCRRRIVCCVSPNKLQSARHYYNACIRAQMNSLLVQPLVFVESHAEQTHFSRVWPCEHFVKLYNGAVENKKHGAMAAYHNLSTAEAEAKSICDSLANLDPERWRIFRGYVFGDDALWNELEFSMDNPDKTSNPYNTIISEKTTVQNSSEADGASRHKQNVEDFRRFESLKLNSSSTAAANPQKDIVARDTTSSRPISPVDSESGGGSSGVRSDRSRSPRREASSTKSSAKKEEDGDDKNSTEPTGENAENIFGVDTATKDSKSLFKSPVEMVAEEKAAMEDTLLRTAFLPSPGEEATVHDTLIQTSKTAVPNLCSTIFLEQPSTANNTALEMTKLINAGVGKAEAQVDSDSPNVELSSPISVPTTALQASPTSDVGSVATLLPGSVAKSRVPRAGDARLGKSTSNAKTKTFSASPSKKKRESMSHMFGIESMDSPGLNSASKKKTSNSHSMLYFDDVDAHQPLPASAIGNAKPDKSMLVQLPTDSVSLSGISIDDDDHPPKVTHTTTTGPTTSAVKDVPSPGRRRAQDEILEELHNYPSSHEADSMKLEFAVATQSAANSTTFHLSPDDNNVSSSSHRCPPQSALEPTNVSLQSLDAADHTIRLPPPMEDLSGLPNITALEQKSKTLDKLKSVLHANQTLEKSLQEIREEVSDVRAEVGDQGISAIPCIREVGDGASTFFGGASFIHDVDELAGELSFAASGGGEEEEEDMLLKTLKPPDKSQIVDVVHVVDLKEADETGSSAAFTDESDTTLEGNPMVMRSRQGSFMDNGVLKLDDMSAIIEELAAHQKSLIAAASPPQVDGGLTSDVDLNSILIQPPALSKSTVARGDRSQIAMADLPRLTSEDVFLSGKKNDNSQLYTLTQPAHFIDNSCIKLPGESPVSSSPDDLVRMVIDRSPDLAESLTQITREVITLSSASAKGEQEGDDFTSENSSPLLNNALEDHFTAATEELRGDARKKRVSSGGQLADQEGLRNSNSSVIVGPAERDCLLQDGTGGDGRASTRVTQQLDTRANTSSSCIFESANETASLKIQSTFRGFAQRKRNAITLHKQIAHSALKLRELMDEKQRKTAYLADLQSRINTQKTSQKVKNPELFDEGNRNRTDLNTESMLGAALKMLQNFREYIKDNDINVDEEDSEEARVVRKFLDDVEAVEMEERGVEITR